MTESNYQRLSRLLARRRAKAAERADVRKQLGRLELSAAQIREINERDRLYELAVKEEEAAILELVMERAKQYHIEFSPRATLEDKILIVAAAADDINGSA